MKTNTILTLVAALGVFSLTAFAEDAGGPPPGGEQGGPGAGGHVMGHRPVPAIIVALDANHDGMIDADEIANAVAALKTLDKNGDGKLTRDEFMGKPPGRPAPEGAGGPPPQDGAGGPPDGAPGNPPPQQ